MNVMFSQRQNVICVKGARGKLNGWVEVEVELNYC